MAIITAENVTDLLSEVEDFNATDWPDSKILELSDEFSQPYFQEVLCRGKTFDFVTYTETLDGNGLYNLTLSHRPVQEIVSVTIDSDAVVLTDVYMYPNRITMKTSFPVGYQNVVVVYKAGYEAAPALVIKAIAMLCACYISRVCGGGGDALSTAITAGPITLKEAFSASGKYAAKISTWQQEISRIAKRYCGTRVISSVRKASSSQRKYDPRSDSYE